MVTQLEKELTEEVPLVAELGQLAPKIEETRAIIANIANLDKGIRSAQEVAKDVSDEYVTLGLARNYDALNSLYNTLITAIGKKYKIAANGIQKYIKSEDLIPYNFALNWLERKVRGFVIAFKDKIRKLGQYAIGLSERYA